MNRNLLGFILFVLAIALGVGLVWPKIGDVQSVTLDRNAKEQVLKTKTDRLNSLATLRSTFETQQPRIDKLITTLPQEAQVQELLVSFESLAQQSGVTIQSIVPQDNSRDQRVLVTVTGDGELGAIESFLQGISQNDRPMSISSVATSRTPDGRRLNFTFSLYAPYVSAPKVVTPTVTTNEESL